jgi:2-dehydro-3-deoxyphosphogluconate aldolase/(4S)-4-hydroxy-2-oxoglutarate aldolase
MKVVDAIREGGVPVLEITMTVPGAIGVMEEVARRFGADVVLGAGTVLDAETARACILAGARFVVSPALSLGTIEMCRRYSVAVIPGALTPTEVVAAWSAGADVVKIFPCGALGGASYIKSLKAPLPQVEMIPTGGGFREDRRRFHQGRLDGPRRGGRPGGHGGDPRRQRQSRDRKGPGIRALGPGGTIPGLRN